MIDDGFVQPLSGVLEFQLFPPVGHPEFFFAALGRQDLDVEIGERVLLGFAHDFHEALPEFSERHGRTGTVMQGVEPVVGDAGGSAGLACQAVDEARQRPRDEEVVHVEGAAHRDKVVAALKDKKTNEDRDRVDVIIALGMAKEGFDWIWCEHALTIGYRNSLTEIIQIIGRATRDAPNKTRARFTNLIAEPDASEDTVVDAINDTLKAIAASLLMEQVLAPKINFTPKNQGPQEGYDYGEGGYDPNGKNIGVNTETGQYHIELKGLAQPESAEAKRICEEDLNEVITAFVQDTRVMAKGLFDEEMAPQDLNILQMGKIISDKYPDLSENDQEAIRERAVAAFNLIQQAHKQMAGESKDDTPVANTALIDGVRRFAMDVRELDIDLIDSKNPFEAAYNILSNARRRRAARGAGHGRPGRRQHLESHPRQAKGRHPGRRGRRQPRTLQGFREVQAAVRNDP